MFCLFALFFRKCLNKIEFEKYIHPKAVFRGKPILKPGKIGYYSRKKMREQNSRKRTPGSKSQGKTHGFGQTNRAVWQKICQKNLSYKRKIFLKCQKPANFHTDFKGIRVFYLQFSNHLNIDLKLETRSG